MTPIYLDNNATTRLHPEVLEAMVECDRSGYANPASTHAEGRRARKVLETARRGIGQILDIRDCGTRPDRIIFTSGGTEANNLALRGLGGDASGPSLVSAIEHPSVLQAAALRPAQVSHLPSDPEGRVRVEFLELWLAETAPSQASSRLVSVMLGNHETGVLQPVAEIAGICRRHRVLVHCDAVQAVGKVPVSFQELSVDALTATAHKFHGPRGIGMLVARHGVPLRPLMVGGAQQLGLRAGTESVTLAVGMWRALDIWQRESADRASRMTALRQRLERFLSEQVGRVVFLGSGAERLPQTLCVAFPGTDRQALLMALDQAGIACSAGSACASGSSEPSPVLRAMGCSDQVLESAIRLSLSAETSLEEIEVAGDRLVRAVQRLAELST